MYARARGRDVPAIPDFTEAQKVAQEFEILGLSARRHLLTYLAPPRKTDSRAIAGAAGKRITLLGIMATSRLTETAKSEPMEFLTMEDELRGTGSPDHVLKMARRSRRGLQCAT